MTSSRPYLLRAIYDWLLDNQMTPYIMVDALMPNVMVPETFIKDGKIVLNVTPQAVHRLALGNNAVEFDARFSGISHHIYVPIAAVKAIYAFENGRGMVFNEDEDGGDDGGNSPPNDGGNDDKKAPFLRVVK